MISRVDASCSPGRVGLNGRPAAWVSASVTWLKIFPYRRSPPSTPRQTPCWTGGTTDRRRTLPRVAPTSPLAGSGVGHDDLFGLRGGARDGDGYQGLALPEPFRKLLQQRMPVPLVDGVPRQRQLMHLALARDAFRQTRSWPFRTGVAPGPYSRPKRASGRTTTVRPGARAAPRSRAAGRVESSCVRASAILASRAS